MKTGWLGREAFAGLVEEGTTAFRLWSGAGAWVERFGESALVSASSVEGIDRLAFELQSYVGDVGWDCRRVYGRLLVRTPGASDRPSLLFGEAESGSREVVQESRLRYEVDFSASYSVGLFCDQRENRSFLREFGPKRFLNTFSYTCAFSVVAASVGAITTSVDVSKSALERGRRNFGLNGINLEGHRFVEEDVLTYLGRLAKRGERFDAILLDPPTFGRGGGKRTFRVAKDFPELVNAAAALALPGAALLLSSNFLEWTDGDLEAMGSAVLPERTQFLKARRAIDFPSGAGAVSIWAILPQSVSQACS